MNELISKWRKTKERLSQKLKRMPKDEEIAKKLKLSKDKVEHINFWMSSSTSSLDAPIGDEEDSQVSDLIEDKNAASPDATIGIMMDKERVNNLLDIMNDREKEMIDMRFGLHESRMHTLAEVADKLGVSRERIRQIEEAALKKIKKLVTDQESEI